MITIKAGFLDVANYPQWIVNILPVPKKDGKVHMCVDYRDLNRASPKDDFICLTLMWWWTTQLNSLYSPLWMASSVTTKS